jgi:hypothetical protein
MSGSKEQLEYADRAQILKTFKYLCEIHNISDVRFATKIQHIVGAGHFDYLFPDRGLRTPTPYSIISNKLLHIVKRVANEPDEE